MFIDTDGKSKRGIPVPPKINYYPKPKPAVPVLPVQLQAQQEPVLFRGAPKTPAHTYYGKESSSTVARESLYTPSYDSESLDDDEASKAYEEIFSMDDDQNREYTSTSRTARSPTTKG